MSVSVGPSTALDAAAILKALDRYPFGCSEQITSRALPLALCERAREIRAARDRHRGRSAHPRCHRPACWRGRAPTVRSGLWSVGGEDAWLDAYVTDFLTRARERGFVVPDVAFRQAIDHLRNFVSVGAGAFEGRRARSRLCALCARAQFGGAGRRSSLHRRHQAERSRTRRSPRRRSRPRSDCSAIVRAPSAFMRRRSRRLRRRRRSGRARRLRLVAA